MLIILLTQFKVFDENDEMTSLCNRISSPLVVKLLKGYNTALVMYGQTGTGKTSTLIGTRTHEQMKIVNDEDDREVSLIESISKEIFQLMKDSPGEIEFNVKISYLEIYLEQIRDLLTPSNRFLNFIEGDSLEESKVDGDMGPKIEGLSEVCCVSASDITELVKKGHAYRVLSEHRKGTDLYRSHSVISIKIEQRNMLSKKIVKSTLQIVDMAGSELDESRDNKRNLLTAPHSRQLEKSLSNRSHSALESVVKSLESDDSSASDRSKVFRGSKVTSILREALGGNSFCSFLLTASPASINIQYTLSTLRYGKRLQKVTNYPVINIQKTQKECNVELQKSKANQAKLSEIIRQFQRELEKGIGNLSHSERDLWDNLNDICSRSKLVLGGNFDGEQNHRDLPLEEKLRLEQERVENLQQTLREVSYARNLAQRSCDTLQGECLFLRKESEDILEAKKKNTMDLIDVQNEIQIMSQRKIALDHNLRTSRFRESEAVVFLRHFRHFYRRLLEKLNAQGSGDLNAVISHLVGAPDLNEMNDLDVLLMESGLLEDSEVGNESDIQDYLPSTNALLRSSSHANESRSARNIVNGLQGIQAPNSPGRFPRRNSGSQQSPSRIVQRLESIRNAVSRSLSGSVEDSGGSQTISTMTMSGFNADTSGNISYSPSYSSQSPSLDGHENQNSPPYSLTIPRSPSKRLSDDKVLDLENEVVELSKRCIDLQTSLNAAEETIETLSAKRKNTKIAKNVKEQMAMKTELDKKAADLEAIVWKMNELHMVNRSYSEKMSNRDARINSLEESLRKCQDQNLQLVTVHIENEKKMRDEVDRLNNLIDSMTTKLWQDGEVQLPLERRIIIPFQGTGKTSLPEKDLWSEGRDESETGHDEGKKESSPNKTVEVVSRGNETKLTRFDPNIDVAALCVGGKPKNYVPRRFATKRGDEIKSAIWDDSSISNDTRTSVTLATVRRQMNQLDQLTKSWNNSTGNNFDQ